MLNVEGVSVRYGSRDALRDISFSVRPGEWWMIVGPNGAGKSTLLTVIDRGVPFEGGIQLLGKNLQSYSPRELAQNVGILSQIRSIQYGYTVLQVVNLGRYAYKRGYFGAADEDGENSVRLALRQTGLDGMENRSIQTLSGGELQRVFLAQALAQQPRLLMLDEPANHLDLIYQKQIFTLIGRWLASPGRAVVSVVHDLTDARRYGTHALLLREGRCAAKGSIGDVFVPEKLNAAYDMDVFSWLRELTEPWRE